MRQIARKLNKDELRFLVRAHKFDTGGLTPGKENLCAMTENMQADDVQRRKPRVVRCCLNIEVGVDIRFYHINHSISVKNDSMNSLNRMKYNIYHKSQNHLL